MGIILLPGTQNGPNGPSSATGIMDLQVSALSQGWGKLLDQARDERIFLAHLGSSLNMIEPSLAMKYLPEGI